MRFRSEYEATPRPQLPIDKEVVLIGSCFSDEIGAKLQECGLPCYANRCGPLYNPASIANAVRLSLGQREPLTTEWDGRRLYLDFPTRFASLQAIQESLPSAQSWHRASTLLLTFGTAWVYEFEGEIVGNCHKLPAAMFARRRMVVEEIAALWERMAADLRVLNPDLRIVLTVSPVRHLKDGFAGNARSKATLLLACEELERRGVGEYFPAYEIVMDDLRDYRFYGADLTHPSPMAVDYVWEKFCATYFSASQRAVLSEGRAITAALRHRPLLDNPEAIKRHLEATARRLREFRGKHPGMFSGVEETLD